jgi:hypothetical protein
MNKTRCRALRLALYFDVVHIRPQIIGDSYKEYVESFEQQSPRRSKDYELRHTSAETIIHIAFAHQMLRRIS